MRSLDTSSGAQSLDGGPSDGEPALSPMRDRLGPNRLQLHRARLTAEPASGIFAGMGTLRSPHEATSPSIASRFFYEGAAMSSYTTISPDKLARLIGTANMPVLIDVRTEADFAADPRLIPGAVRRSHEDAADWSGEFSGRFGHRRLPARRRSWRKAPPPGCGTLDVAAETLEGGFEGWKAAKLPLVHASKLPPRDAQGPHRLGDAGAAEDRPHRLPLADPPLRRSERGVPVRRAVRSGRGRRALQRHARSTSRTCSGATAASSAPST